MSLSLTRIGRYLPRQTLFDEAPLGVFNFVKSYKLACSFEVYGEFITATRTYLAWLLVRHLKKYPGNAHIKLREQ